MLGGPLPYQQKLATEAEKHPVTETLESCFSRSGNATRLKNISKKRLSSQLKLATDKGRQLTTET